MLPGCSPHRPLHLQHPCTNEGPHGTYDHGGTLKHHGAYNMLVLVVFVIPTLAFLVVEYGLWHVVGWRKLVDGHLPIFIVTAAVMMVSLYKANQLWNQGFPGKRILAFQNQSAICTQLDSGLPWVDILPAGAQNFQWARCNATINMT